MKLGSLFDGSGGFPLAAKNVGITPIWASEVELYPIAVTRQNLPEVEHLGDVTKIDGAKIDPVEIITFGSPCQDMSVAGLRRGLGGSKSRLFYDAVRIIKEMREATNGENPRFAIWENVLGSLFSNDGNDFGCVINELLAIVGVDPVVRPTGKWRHAGAVCGDEFSLAWRVLDARYFGVPQRRRRVFVVCDFRGQSAPEILFKAKDLRVLPKQSGEERDGHAPDSETSVNSASGRRVFCLGGNSKRPSTNGKGWLDDDSSYTLNTVDRHVVAVATGSEKCLNNVNIAPTLVADSGFSKPSFICAGNNNVVRFLTPSECAKLQGFPANWGKVKAIPEDQLPFWRKAFDEYSAIYGIKSKSDKQILNWMHSPYSESSEYKMWGNGVALPCVEYILGNVADLEDFRE